MSATTINDGGTFIKDPSAIRTYTFNWDDHLASGVTVTTSTVVVTQVSGSTTTPLVADGSTSPLGIQSGSRTVKFKLSAGTLGARYRVDNTVVTNESPTQTIQKSATCKVEDE